MKKAVFLTAVSGLALIASGSMAQTIDNNFARDRGTSVTERARAEYAPLGLRLGAFMANTTVETSAGYTDNLYYNNARKESDASLGIRPQVDVNSTWSRHAVSFGAGSDIVSYSGNGDENTTSWNAYLRGRVDISSAATIAASYSHNRNYESRSSFQASLTSIEPVPYDIDAASITTTIVGNRLRFMGTLSSTNEDYKNVASLGGGIIDNSARDAKVNVVAGRVDYAVSPSVSVFVNAESNERKYASNPSYNNEGTILTVGSSFEITGLSRGELQIGRQKQDYSAVTAGDQSTTYINGKVEWFPTQLTSVTGKIERNVTDTPNISGPNVSAVYTAASIGVDHELLRNVLLLAEYQHTAYDFSGIDRSDNGDRVTLGGRYYMSRRISLDAAYRYENYKSSGTQAFREFTNNWIRLGVTWRY